MAKPHMILTSLAAALTALALGGLHPAPSVAAERTVKCQLVVKGKTYMNGPCRYDADPDGSFRVFGDKYFAYVTVLTPGVADASWNADPKSTHAQAALGELKRDGACWKSKTVRVCAFASEPYLSLTGAPAATLVYEVSQNSPLLSAKDRVDISQDFNGVPLDGKPTIRRVTAEHIACQGATAGNGKTCTLRFGRKVSRSVSGEAAASLSDALVLAGAVGPTAEITDLSCTVDDHVAQTTPAIGAAVAGFSCQLRLRP